MNKLKEITWECENTTISGDDLAIKLKKLCDETTVTKTEIILTLIEVIRINQNHICNQNHEIQRLKTSKNVFAEKLHVTETNNFQLAELLAKEQLKNSALIKQLEKINEEKNND